MSLGAFGPAASSSNTQRPLTEAKLPSTPPPNETHAVPFHRARPLEGANVPLTKFPPATKDAGFGPGPSSSNIARARTLWLGWHRPPPTAFQAPPSQQATPLAGVPPTDWKSPPM